MGRKHISVWIDEEILKRCDANIKVAKTNNRSEFLAEAAEFYIGYLHSQNSDKFISKTLLRAFQSTVDAAEDRTARLLFKQAVESAKIFWTLVQGLGIEPEKADLMHEECVEEVKSINGALRKSYDSKGDDK